MTLGQHASKFDPTGPPPRRRLTIGDHMRFAVLAALMLGAARSITVGDGPEAGILIIAVFCVPLVAAARDLYHAGLGVGCPRCGEPAMARVAVRPFGPRYYRCPRCGARRMRTMVGFWSDAEGRAHAAAYERASAGGKYQPGPDLEFGPDPGSTTTGRLLRGKWDRLGLDAARPVGAPDPEPTPPPGGRG